MTEELNASGSVASAEAPVTNNVATQSSTASDSLPEPRAFYQDEIDSIVKKAKHQAYEKGRREAASEYGNKAVGSVTEQTQNSTTPAADVQKLIDERVQQHLQNLNTQARSKQIESNFLAQLENGKKDYPDFDEKMKMLGNFESVLPVILLGDHLGLKNMHDVMYDVVENPTKLANILNIANLNPQLAAQELSKWSGSLQANREAKGKVKVPGAPLDSVKPSVMIQDGQGGNSVNYYKSKYRG